jgi:polyisoprenoid-binding protein YceI
VLIFFIVEVKPMARINAGRLVANSLRILLALASMAAPSHSQQLRFDFVPANTTIRFTLGDILHTIHGSFQLKNGEIGYNPETGAIEGSLVVDSSSGQSGNRARDRKMHREVLESARYPEITFRPDRVTAKVARSGASSVELHGIFSIHGLDHELTIPVEVHILPDHWVADAHFTIPYVKWGMRNPSRFFLRVSESVAIDVHASGNGSPAPQ